MLPPQQQIFNKVFEVCLSLGFSTFDFLPAEGEKYPFVYIGEQSDVDRENKSTVTGLVMQSIHFYGDYRKRGDLSVMMNDLKRELRKLKNTTNFYINVKNMPEAPEMQQGKNRILLFRNLKEQGEVDGIKLVFQTGHTFEMSRAIDKVNTKDGSINKIGDLETEVDINAIQAKKDPVGDMLRDSVYNAETLELWEVTIDEDLKNEEGKYPAVYAQGNLDKWEWTADVEDEATIASTFFVNLKPQFGYTALTEEQENAVQYAFREIQAATEQVSEPIVGDVTSTTDGAEVEVS